VGLCFVLRVCALCVCVLCVCAHAFVWLVCACLLAPLLGRLVWVCWVILTGGGERSVSVSVTRGLSIQSPCPKAVSPLRVCIQHLRLSHVENFAATR
jgi:hypothetical protein